MTSCEPTQTGRRTGADDGRTGPGVPGLLLAAGAGRRMGGPKALRRDPDGRSWVQRRCRALAQGGCRPVYVVLGAAADQVRDLLDDDVIAVEATAWSEGMGASLRTGLEALRTTDAELALVTLVDLPGVGADVVRRVRRAAQGHTEPESVLLRAAYDRTPGHPVVLGRRHWEGVAAEAVGDRGARVYLGRHDVRLIECADIGHGRDVDTAQAEP